MPPVRSHSTPASVELSSDENSAHRPLWKLTCSELNEFQITPLSKYKDDTWRRIPTTTGHTETDASFNWAMELTDGSRPTDQQHSRRLAWSKKLMALILHAPASGRTPGDLSIPQFQQGFNMLLSWMSERALYLPEELTPQIIESYVEDLPRFLAERSGDGDEEITQSQVHRALLILPRLWSERGLMAKWGIPSLETNPFYKKGIGTYARNIATKAKGWIQPLPDEVAIPLFNKAAWLLGEPAEDVIAIVDYVINDPWSGQKVVVRTRQSSNGIRTQKSGKSPNARYSRINRFLAGFTFQTLPGAEGPWHPALDEEYEVENGRNLHVRVRQLHDAVRDACAITIQGMTGMRISELMGIQAGFDETNRLPKGVRIEPTVSGLYELFLISTVLSKTEEGMPRTVDWILGMRPAGSSDEPLAVRALRVLNRLQAPWREQATTPLLLLTDRNGDTLPLKTTVLGAMSYDNMSQGIKTFIERWVDLSRLPDQGIHAITESDLVRWRESKGRCFTSHMLRKSWARFVFAVHPNLMPAIALQFHHLSIAMTDSGYIGSNPLVVGTMNEVAEQNTYNLMFEAVMGKRMLAGKMGEQIESATRGFAEKVKHLPLTDAYKQVRSYCDRVGLKTFFGPYGGCCPVNASKMRCQDEVGTPIAIRQQPNWAIRQPSLCAGCACFILDEHHVPFWQDRYVENQIAYRRAEAQGMAHGFRVIKERGEQAGKLLKAIRINLAPLDRQVEQAL